MYHKCVLWEHVALPALLWTDVLPPRASIYLLHPQNYMCAICSWIPCFMQKNIQHVADCVVVTCEIIYAVIRNTTQNKFVRNLRSSQRRWVTGHKQETAGFPESKTIPRSTAISTVSNSMHYTTTNWTNITQPQSLRIACAYSSDALMWFALY